MRCRGGIRPAVGLSDHFAGPFEIEFPGLESVTARHNDLILEEHGAFPATGKRAQIDPRIIGLHCRVMLVPPLNPV